ncbi:peptidase domain-containing ABC transporter [Novibacillus thermophilus]|uniref:peptidase domain-containing ABC transporter n=1 Tax=Novibacillus thermophilus TaxID=1471761 RepID=UPI0014763C10|nr:peptidase domain-containing ABC transporter [Novibacillus thermophilus]
MLSRLPYIEQMEHSECGLACLAMICGYYKKHVTLTELREEFGVSKSGMSLFHLKKISEKLDFDVKAYRGDITTVSKSALPVIVFWEQRHYVVLEKMTKKYLYIVDPASGRRRLTIDEFNTSYSGIFLSLKPNAHWRKRKKQSSWGFYIKHAFKQPKWIVLVLLFSTLLQGLGILNPMLTQWITDEVLVPKNVSFISILGYAVFMLYLFYNLNLMARGYVVTKLQKHMDHALMSHFTQHLFKLPYQFFENRSSGDLLFRANSNTFIRSVFSNRLISLMIDCMLLFFYAALLVWYIPSMGIFVILSGVVCFVILLLSTSITQRLTSKEVEAQAKVQSITAENIHNICDIKVMGLERASYDTWEKNFMQQLVATEKRNLWDTFLNVISSGYQFILPVFLLWMGSSRVIEGSVSLGTLVAFSNLASSFMAPIVSIGTAYNEVILVNNYIKRIKDVVDSRAEGSKQNVSLQKLRGKIEIKNVDFRYSPYDEYVLKNVTLTIHPGEKVAIVGSSGSGKSTLAKLILGLYRATNGEVYIDDYPLSDYDLKSVRREIGTVLQETRLFNTTIYDNIVMNQPGLSIEQAVNAAKMAEIHDEIMKLPLGYYTVVSENGINFSGGQRQRLLIARALVTEPSILILDEATSSLDSVTEKKIMERLHTLECTRVMIAHRLSTIKNADRILVMHKGTIVEQGDHLSLYQKGGHYYHLYTQQLERADENSPLIR